jgi:hypothetical protein
MTDQPSVPLLDQLLTEVESLEQNLGVKGPEKPGTQAIQNFRLTEIRLGDPRDRLTHLTPQLFEGLGFQLDLITQDQMKKRFHFYYMTLSVSLQATGGVQFSELSSALDLGPKGKKQPIVASIFPTSEWKDVIGFGGGMKIGLDGSLAFKAGVDLTPAMKTALAALAPEAQAKIGSENQMKAFIEMPDFSYKSGRSEIVATGPGDSRCSWEITKPSIKQLHTLQFGLVFKVPQTVRKIDLVGEAAAEISYPWLVAQLDQVWDRLGDAFKRILASPDAERKEAERLRLHPTENWTLDLPV